jgi:hypothetical protein
MEIRPLTPRDEPLWDEFCARNGGAWFWQTTPYLKYQRAYRPSAETAPLDFMIVRGGRPIAICPLAREKVPGGGPPRSAFSLGEDHLPSPVVEDALVRSDRERVLAAVFAEVDRLAAKEGAARASFRESVLTPRILAPQVSPANELVRFGCIDDSLQTHVLDLRPDAARLWSDMRRSYHSVIHRAGERFAFQLLDASTVTDELFRLYRELHHKDAGRVTRPLETFEMMLGWIRSGNALLAQAVFENRVLACALAIVYKGGAYYASGCTDPDFEDPGALGPYLQWNVIEGLKARGVTHYELGWQFYGPQLAYVPSKKDLSIAFFKRGFGGTTLPFFRGEKYYSRDFFAEEYGRRLDAVAAP